MRNLFILWSLLWGAHALCSSAQTLPLDEAVESGKVELETGALGGSTGDTIVLTVQRRAVRVSPSPGTAFTERCRELQNMVAAPLEGRRIGKASYPPRSQAALHDNVRVVELVVNEEYQHAEKVTLGVVREDIEQMLATAGARVAKTDDQEPDARLIITIKGTAFGHHYNIVTNESVIRKVLFYDGARIEGKMTFVIGKQKYTQEFKGEHATNYMSPIAPPADANKPRSAPFGYAFLESDFVPRFAKMLSHIFGVHHLKPLIGLINGANPSGACSFLLDTPTAAAEPLILVLNNQEEWVFGDEKPWFRQAVVKVLQMVTGEHLGNEPERWKKCWESNKAKFMRKGNLFKKHSGVSYDFLSPKTRVKVPIPQGGFPAFIYPAQGEK